MKQIKISATLPVLGRITDNVIAKLLDARQHTHGNFGETAAVAQAIKAAMRGNLNWSSLSPGQKEALEAIAVKQARIVCGDSEFEDHWNDIAGWALKAAESFKPF